MPKGRCDHDWKYGGKEKREIHGEVFMAKVYVCTKCGAYRYDFTEVNYG